MVKNPPANAGDTRDEGSIPGLGRFPRGGHGNPLQYSCLENSMDRGATVHGVTKGLTQLSACAHTHTHRFRTEVTEIVGQMLNSEGKHTCVCVCAHMCVCF